MTSLGQFIRLIDQGLCDQTVCTFPLRIERGIEGVWSQSQLISGERQEESVSRSVILFLMIAAVNSHHTSVWTGRADVSTTESLPPSCSCEAPAASITSAAAWMEMEISPFVGRRGELVQGNVRRLLVRTWLVSQVWPWLSLMFYGRNRFLMLIWYTAAQCSMY